MSYTESGLSPCLLLLLPQSGRHLNSRVEPWRHTWLIIIALNFYNVVKFKCMPEQKPPPHQLRTT